VICTVAAAVLGPGSWRGNDTGAVVTAVATTLLPALIAVLRRGPGGSAAWPAAGQGVLVTASAGHVT
jgi:hypothetical protein